MRLTEAEQKIIISMVSKAFAEQKHWQLWLFGSRVNDCLKGGDVDLCIVAGEDPKDLLQKKLWLRGSLEEALDLPVDLIMQSMQRPPKLVTKQAIETGVLLAENEGIKAVS